MYPVFLKLTGRRVVLVGGGQVAAGKLAGLLADGAHVTVVAPEIRPELRAARRDDRSATRSSRRISTMSGTWWRRRRRTSTRQVLDAAEQRHVFVNAVDDPAHATAYAGGVVRASGRDDRVFDRWPSTRAGWSAA